MELTTAQAINVLLSTPKWRKPKLFAVDDYSFYRILDIDYTEEYAVFMVQDINRKSTSYKRVFEAKVFTYPIRDSKSRTRSDFSILISERMENYLSCREAGIL